MDNAPEPIPQREAVTEFEPIGITAFTTTRSAGDFALTGPVPAEVNTVRWSALLDSLAPAASGLISAHQVHGSEVSVQAESWTGWRRLDGVDAHIVAVRGAAAVTVADCVPVFVAHPAGTVGLIHAGWRGVAGQLLPKVIALLQASGISPADLHVHLGPAICGRCYEVGPDVYEQLTGWQTTRHRYVDLRALLAEQARNAGAAGISSSAWCTRCDRERFYSHRGGDAARQIGVIVARDP